MHIVKIRCVDNKIEIIKMYILAENSQCAVRKRVQMILKDSDEIERETAREREERERERERERENAI